MIAKNNLEHYHGLPALTAEELESYHAIATLFGSRWILPVLDAIARKIYRPGDILTATEGISGTTLHRSLNRLEASDLICRKVRSTRPAHTEYKLTRRGAEWLEVLALIRNIVATQQPLPVCKL
ncbi:MAG: winged helix-turn-helix transcriptional regulator [Fimbriimonadaceae bacterium]